MFGLSPLTNANSQSVGRMTAREDLRVWEGSEA